MKTLRFIAVICLFSLILNNLSYGQTDNSTDKVKYNTWSVTLSGGSMLFYGDLRQFDFYPVKTQNSKDWYAFTTGYSEWDRGFGIDISKQLSPIFGIQGMLQKGGLCGFRTNGSVQAHFNSSFLTYGLKVKINILPIINPGLKSPKFAIYGITGIGLCDFRSRQWSLIDEQLIQSFGYDYATGGATDKIETTTETVVPLGLGIKYKIAKKFDLGIESTINNVNTDKLDARVVTGSAKDKYGYTALTLTYTFGKNDKSLEWTAPKDMESDNLAPLFAKINKRIDSLGQKLNDLEARMTKAEKDIDLLKNPPTEADDDGDGVPNSKDLEPGTPKGTLVNFQGITIPKATTTSSTTQPIFSIYFAVNSAVIDEANQEKVAAAAKMLKDDANLKFDLIGHADKTGGAVYNDLLSKRRSQAVYDLLTKSFGIDAARLTVDGKGYNDPLSTDILSVNRRVDFIKK